jgi:hypothetical protein
MFPSPYQIHNIANWLYLQVKSCPASEKNLVVKDLRQFRGLVHNGIMTSRSSTLAGIPVTATAHSVKGRGGRILEGSFSVPLFESRTLDKSFGENSPVVYKGTLIEDGQEFDVSADVVLSSFNIRGQTIHGAFRFAPNGKVHYKNPL